MHRQMAKCSTWQKGRGYQEPLALVQLQPSKANMREICEVLEKDKDHLPGE